VRRGLVPHRTRRAGEGADGAPAGTHGEAQALDRLAA